MNAKWTSDDVPGRHGRLAVVTGANIRYVTAHARPGETNVAAMAVAHGYTVAAAIFLGAAVITGLLLRKHAPPGRQPGGRSRAGNSNCRGADSPVDSRDTARLIDEGYRLATGWLASHPVLGRVVA